MKISIGVPVKNEVGNIQLLGRQLSSLLDDEKYQHLEFEILVNENNSTDGSESAILEWQKSDSRVVMFSLREQLEFQSSIQDLMQKSTGDAFCLIQSDLQDPVEVLERMIDAWLQQPDHLIVGQIMRRKERNLVNLGRKAFYCFLDSSSDGVYREGIQDFYVLPQFIYEKIANLPCMNLFIRGYLVFNYSKIVYIEYERDARKNGKSKFRFADMYELALDGLLLHGKRFVRLLSVTSFTIFFFTFVGIILLLIASLIGFESGSKGWTSLILAISFAVSFLGLVVGLILEYLIRIYRHLLLER